VAAEVNNLGSVLNDLGELQEAQKCFERALKIDETVFGKDHSKAGTDIEPGAGVSVPSIFFSAITGEGKEDLWRWISERI
jgi:tetratricopeptide (TPR) repeat protein